MDRSSFLGSLPFLLPLASQSWPPRTSSVVSFAAAAESNSEPAEAGTMTGGQPAQAATPPPTTTTPTAAVGSRRHEVLLKDHRACIEPTNTAETAASGHKTDRHRSLGPCFVGTSSSGCNENYDPSLFSFEMAMEFVRIAGQGEQQQHDFHSACESPFSFSTTSSRNRHPFDEKKMMMTEEEEEQVAVFVRFDGQRVFQVDLAAMQHVEVLQQNSSTAVAASNNNNGANKNGKGIQTTTKKTTNALPACLLLHFPGSLLRIFSLAPEGGNGEGDEGYDLLLSARKELVKFLTTAVLPAAVNTSITTGIDNKDVIHRPPSSPLPASSLWPPTFFLSAEAITSPTGSSQPSSSERGQKEITEQEAQAQIVDKNRNSKHDNENDSRSSACDSPPLLPIPAERLQRRMKRCRQAYERCQTTVRSLQTVMSMPVASSFFGVDEDEEDGATPSATTSGSSTVERVAPLLAACGDDLSASYCRQTDLSAAHRAAERDLVQCKNILDKELLHFFPERHSQSQNRGQKRRRQQQQQFGRRNNNNSSSSRGSKSCSSAAVATMPDTTATAAVAAAAVVVNVTKTLEAVQAMIHKQKKIVRERHELFLLPKRG